MPPSQLIASTRSGEFHWQTNAVPFAAHCGVRHAQLPGLLSTDTGVQGPAPERSLCFDCCCCCAEFTIEYDQLAEWIADVKSIFQQDLFEGGSKK